MRLGMQPLLRRKLHPDRLSKSSQRGTDRNSTERWSEVEPHSQNHAAVSTIRCPLIKKAGGGHMRVWNCEIPVIKKIEYVGAELQGQSPGELSILGDAEIH